MHNQLAAVEGQRLLPQQPEAPRAQGGPNGNLRLSRRGASQQQALFGNTARSIGGAPREIQLRHIGNCLKADPAYGKGVADALSIPLGQVPKEA